MKAPSHGTLSKFYMDAMLRANAKKERYGQACFNHLLSVRPDLAEAVRGSDKDVFFMNGPADNFERWDRFAVFIETNWYSEPSVPNTDPLRFPSFDRSSHLIPELDEV